MWKEAGVTAYEDVVQRLRDAFEMLENITLEQASAEPKRADKLTKALTDVTAALGAVEEWQREQEGERRLATLLDELTRYTKEAHERLDASEGRLQAVEQAGLDGGRPGIKPDPELIEEGTALAALLQGPPDDAIDRKYFKDADRVSRVAAIDVLALELESRGQTAGKAGAKP